MGVKICTFARHVRWSINLIVYPGFLSMNWHSLWGIGSQCDTFKRQISQVQNEQFFHKCEMAAAGRSSLGEAGETSITCQAARGNFSLNASWATFDSTSVQPKIVDCIDLDE
jgi:hypothetical protein